MSGQIVSIELGDKDGTIVGSEIMNGYVQIDFRQSIFAEWFSMSLEPEALTALINYLSGVEENLG